MNDRCFWFMLDVCLLIVCFCVCFLYIIPTGCFIYFYINSFTAYLRINLNFQGLVCHCTKLKDNKIVPIHGCYSLTFRLQKRYAGHQFLYLLSKLSPKGLILKKWLTLYLSEKNLEIVHVNWDWSLSSENSYCACDFHVEFLWLPCGVL